MVDYSQFVFHERDHSYGYAEEVSVASGPDYCPYMEHRQLCHQYQGRQLLAEPALDACQDLPLNLSLNSPVWNGGGTPVLRYSAASTPPCSGDETDIEPVEEGETSSSGECPAAPELGSLFIVSDLGAHIAQEEIVESEVVDDDEDATDEEDDSSEEEEEDEGAKQEYSHEMSKNSRLRTKVNDLTKASMKEFIIYGTGTLEAVDLYQNKLRYVVSYIWKFEN